MGKQLDPGNPWTGQRLPESPYDRAPIRATLGWLQQLPPGVVPHELRQGYPRIANRLARLWDTPAACREYLDSLVLDRRGGRRGFAREVLQEIRALREHYWQQYPPEKTRDVWDDVREGQRPLARRGRR